MENNLPDCVPYEQKMQQEKLEDEEAEKLEKLIDGLTDEDEEKLKEAHADVYLGCDDDMSDAYEAWLCDLIREEIIDIIF